MSLPYIYSSRTSWKATGGWGFYFTFQMRLAQIKTPPMIFIFCCWFFSNLNNGERTSTFFWESIETTKISAVKNVYVWPPCSAVCKCSWNSFINFLENYQELYNIILKVNRTLISWDKRKLKKKQKIKGGVYIWNWRVILRLAQIKTPPPGAFHEVPLYCKSYYFSRSKHIEIPSNILEHIKK